MAHWGKFMLRQMAAAAVLLALTAGTAMADYREYVGEWILPCPDGQI